jgi:hypothetical protein
MYRWVATPQALLQHLPQHQRLAVQNPLVQQWPSNQNYKRRLIMLDIIFWIAVGAFVGWNFPQPFWAKIVQEKIQAMIAKGK